MRDTRFPIFHETRDTGFRILHGTTGYGIRDFAFCTGLRENPESRTIPGKVLEFPSRFSNGEHITKALALERSRRHLSEDASLGVSTLPVVEKASFENRLKG